MFLPHDLSEVTLSKETHRIAMIFVNNLEQIHGSNHTLHCHEDVLVDKFDETSLVFIRIT